MKKLNVTVFCKAVYNSSIDVPDNLTEEEAIEYAKEHIKDIPIGELKYVKSSDVLDEDNCELEEDFSQPQNKNVDMVVIWDYFDNYLSQRGYSLSIVTRETQNEEIELFGKVCSPLGTKASKSDKFAPVISLYIPNDYSTATISVIDRNGSNIIEGRTLGRYKISNNLHSIETALNYIMKKFGKYGVKQYVPHELEIETKTF